MINKNGFGNKSLLLITFNLTYKLQMKCNGVLQSTYVDYIDYLPNTLGNLETSAS